MDGNDRRSRIESVVGKDCLDSILFPGSSLVREWHSVVMICSETPAVKAAEAGDTVTRGTKWPWLGERSFRVSMCHWSLRWGGKLES